VGERRVARGAARGGLSGPLPPLCARRLNDGGRDRSRVNRPPGRGVSNRPTGRNRRHCPFRHRPSGGRHRRRNC
jgi:hypothetical protein